MKIEFNNLYTHFVFTTLHRQVLIPERNRIRIEKFITGVIKNYSSKLYAIYANPDHMHFLVSRSPDISETYLVTIVAEASASFINQNKLGNGQFAWQDSASAFSISKSDVDKVCNYILNQKEHHRTVTFQEEYDVFIHHYQKTLHKTK